MPSRSRSDSSGSRASSSSSSSAGDAHAAALAALQAHGADFLAACGMAPAAAAAAAEDDDHDDDAEDHEGEPPAARATAGSTVAASAASASAHKQLASAAPEVRTQAAGKKRAREPVTVVFEQTGRRRTGDEASGGDAQRGSARDFMSSKVQRVHTSQAAGSSRKSGVTSEDEADEKAARANDKELSHLLSTTLFAPGSGASSSTRGLSHGDTAARLAELGASKKELRGATVGRGWGEAKVKAQDMAAMPAAMRAGMRKKEMERQDKRVELAKELGTYHTSLKKMKEVGSDLILGTRRLEKEQRTREKGVGMGVGTFRNGTLKIGKAERERIEGSRGGKTRGRGGRGGAAGRGGKRGRA